MEKEEFEPPKELGIRIFAALISYQMGNALETEYRKIKRGEYGEINPAWAELGWSLLSQMVQSVVDSVTPDGTSTRD